MFGSPRVTWRYLREMPISELNERIDNISPNVEVQPNDLLGELNRRNQWATAEYQAETLKEVAAQQDKAAKQLERLTNKLIIWTVVLVVATLVLVAIEVLHAFRIME